MTYLQFTSLIGRRDRRRLSRGATALEYALVLAFVAVGVVAALNTLSTDVKGSIGSVGKQVQGAQANVK